MHDNISSNFLTREGRVLANGCTHLSSMTIFVHFIYKKCHSKNYHSDTKYYMTPNIIFSALTQFRISTHCRCKFTVSFTIFNPSKFQCAIYRKSHTKNGVTYNPYMGTCMQPLWAYKTKLVRFAELNKNWIFLQFSKQIWICLTYSFAYHIRSLGGSRSCNILAFPADSRPKNHYALSVNINFNLFDPCRLDFQLHCIPFPTISNISPKNIHQLVSQNLHISVRMLTLKRFKSQGLKVARMCLA